MAKKSERTFIDSLAMRRLSTDPPSPDGTDTFESLRPPERMGNPAPIGYGGYTLASGLQAAYHTLSPKGPTKAVYSVLGHYLGPAGIDRPLRPTVVSIRETRTFSTRHVLVAQVQPDGSYRNCLFMAVDFLAQNPDRSSTSMLTFSSGSDFPLPAEFPRPDSVPDFDDSVSARVKDGNLTRKEAEAYKVVFAPYRRFLESRMPPSSTLERRLYGAAPTQATSQDSLPLHKRVSAGWVRSRLPPSALSSVPLATPIPGDVGPKEVLLPTAESFSACLSAFTLDGALSFIPLTHSSLALDAASAVSSLDFALRFHADKLDLGQWHVHELAAKEGGWQRTYSEGKLIDENGSVVATMTQACILRPPVKI